MNINCIKTGYLEENCYVITINNNCIVIDPGDEFDKIKDVIGNKNVLGILITHYHFDHVGALKEIKNYYKVPVIDYKSNHFQHIGNFNFEIILTPGHKEDSVTYYFKKDNIMFVGDFIFKGSVGKCDLDGGNLNDMKKSVNLIKKYDEEIILYPGHGDTTTIGEELENNPYLKGDYYE